MRIIGWTGVVMALMVSVASCDGTSTDPEELLEGGIVATFRVSGEDFRVWVTNPETVDRIFDLQQGTGSANIPNGALRGGRGTADHNAPWSWHLDPEDIEMAESTIEVCDGRPSLVEALLEDYLHVGRFCPWGAELVAVEDYR